MTRKTQRGFTLIELVMVMAVIAILLSTVMKNTAGMMQETNNTKVEGELSTLKAAITSYWKNNSSTYPSDIHTTLVAAAPLMVPSVLKDPFGTDTVHQTYGYITGSDSVFGAYFVIYSKGANADTTPTWDAANQRITYTGSGRVASNAPVIKN